MLIRQYELADSHRLGIEIVRMRASDACWRLFVAGFPFSAESLELYCSRAVLLAELNQEFSGTRPYRKPYLSGESIRWETACKRLKIIW